MQIEEISKQYGEKNLLIHLKRVQHMVRMEQDRANEKNGEKELE